MRSRIGVIALVPDEWDSLWMPRQQILTRLARSFDIVWIEPARDWRDYWSVGGRSILQPRSIREIAPQFTVMTPGCMLPRFYRPAWLRRAVFARTLRLARRYLQRRGANLIVLYVWRYEFAEALELVPHDVSCYHVDDEYSFSEVEVPADPRETRLLASADQVIVHSSRLLQTKGGVNPRTALIPNGVDYRAFSAKLEEPTDLAAVPHPRVGYIGVIKKQLDLTLLVRLARARPGWSFVLVGPVGNVTGKEHVVSELRTMPNVYLLGRKPVDRLAAYTQHMDVCLMCYEVNDYTNYIYPLKLHEYLAAGRPTVSAPITSVLEHADVVTLARSDEEWLRGITRALEVEASALPETERRRERARHFDWDDLAEKVAGLFRERLRVK